MIVKPETFLTRAEHAALRQRSDLVGALLVAHCWGLIFAAMALFALWPNPLTFLVAVLIIGGRQLGLAILMHDAAHNLLFRTRWLNEAVGQVLCAWPVAADLFAYRPYHFQHHRHTQQAEDPDLPLSAPFPISRQSLWRKMLRDITGQTAYTRRRLQMMEAWGPPGLTPAARLERLGERLGGAALANFVLFGILAMVGQAQLYVLLWLLPNATWFQVIVRLRNIAEHAAVPDGDDVLRNTRTTRASWLEGLLIAPYWVNYHLEHHLFLFTPCWRLPEAHRLMLAKGLGPRMEIQPGYWSVIRAATSAAVDRRNQRVQTVMGPAQI